MPLFSRHAEPEQEPAPVYEEPPKRRGFFGTRDRSPSAGTNTTHSTSTTQRTSPERSSGGIFRRSTDASHTGSYAGSHTGSQRTGGGGGGFLHRSFGHGNSSDLDPSILQARERVMSAEAAEREADRALMLARDSVRSAREEVRRLELEAKEEARLAKIKQHHAKEVSKRGKQLGRMSS